MILRIFWDKWRGNTIAALVSVSFGQIMVSLDNSVVAIANPQIARQLEASTVELQWITNSYLLSLGALLVLGGRLGDRFGQRRVFLVGLCGFGVASALIALSGSVSSVIGFRAVQGAFGAMLIPNSLALLRQVFTDEKFSTAVAIWSGSAAVATAAGPIVGGFLIESSSWQSVFYLNVPVAGLAALVTRCALPGISTHRRTTPLDLPGILTFSIGIFFLVLGIFALHGSSIASAPVLFIAAAVVLICFVAIETHRSCPFVDITLLSNRSFLAGISTTLIGFFSIVGVLFFLTLYLQNIRAYSAVGSGSRVLSLSLMQILGSLLSSALSRRYGRKVSLSVGFGITGVGLLSFLNLTVISSDVNLAVSLALVGLGAGIGLTTSATTAVASVTSTKSGTASGLQSTAMQIGGVLGNAVLSVLMMSWVRAALPQQLHDSGVPAAEVPRVMLRSDSVVQGIAPFPGLGAPASESFMAGFHGVAMASGLLCFFASVLGLLADGSKVHRRNVEQDQGDTGGRH